MTLVAATALALGLAAPAGAQTPILIDVSFTPALVTAVYRFIDSGAGFGPTPCPTFQNIGIFACDSDLLRDFGAFDVQGGTDPPAVPQLTSLAVGPAAATPGDVITATIGTTDASDVEAFFVVRPAGTNGALPFGPFQETAGTFVATAALPLNTATGTWHVREIGLRDSGGDIYRFIDVDFAAGLPACPTFQNIGRFACASDLVRDSGAFDVGGANLPLPYPALISVAYTPALVPEGGQTEVTLEIVNADEIEGFFLIRPDGTFGSLPVGAFHRSGSPFTGTIDVPAGTAHGVWSLRELGVRDGIDEVYRFIDASAGAGFPSCPTFQNICVFGCASDLLRTSARSRSARRRHRWRRSTSSSPTCRRPSGRARSRPVRGRC